MEKLKKVINLVGPTSMICTTALIFLKLIRTDLEIDWIHTLIPVIIYSILLITLTILILISVYKMAKESDSNGGDKDEEEYRKHLEESRRKIIQLRNKLS